MQFDHLDRHAFQLFQILYFFAKRGGPKTCTLITIYEQAEVKRHENDDLCQGEHVYRATSDTLYVILWSSSVVH